MNVKMWAASGLLAVGGLFGVGQAAVLPAPPPVRCETVNYLAKLPSGFTVAIRRDLLCAPGAPAITLNCRPSQVVGLRPGIFPPLVRYTCTKSA